MTLKVVRLLLLMWSFGVLGAMAAQADPAAVDPGSPQGTSILQPAVDAAVAALGKSARLEVRHLAVSGDWAFVDATLLDLDGGPFDYTGTPEEEAAANHAKSSRYAALLRNGGAGWALVDQAIGPTDVAWLRWPQQYGVPQSLVEVAEN